MTLGAAIGGARFLWTPAVWLELFVGVYVAGFSAALAVFLKKNLLLTVKEEE